MTIRCHSAMSVGVPPSSLLRVTGTSFWKRSVSSVSRIVRIPRVMCLAMGSILTDQPVLPSGPSQMGRVSISVVFPLRLF